MKFLRKSNKEQPMPLAATQMETHVKLQASQEEFLKWLEASEKRQNDDHDGYNYRKVR